MKVLINAFWIFAISVTPAFSQTTLGPGEQPQVAVDNKGLVHLVYGEKDKIFYSTSGDNGKTFTTPALIGEVEGMQLGMSRGPQLATSKDFSVVTAMDKVGNIHSFQLNHATGKWTVDKNVNDVNASAPEGLMSITADNNNNFYAVWLDLREDEKNNICFSSRSRTSSWSKNQFAYKSPESHVCECCKPSIEVKGNTIAIMFRNWLMGSRDLYLITSTNQGKNFTKAQKLGNGTWQLKGCPMDGGGLAIDAANNIHTVWQREGQIYYAQPGKPEQKIGEGRSVSMHGSLVNWEKGSALYVKRVNGEQQHVGEGTGLQVYELGDKTIFAVWEKDNQIQYKKLMPL